MSAVDEHRTDAWRHAGYRSLWAACTASAIGTEVSSLAIPLTVVHTVDAGPIRRLIDVPDAA